MTAVGDMYSSSAALVKLPQSATQTKTVSWLLYTVLPPSIV